MRVATSATPSDQRPRLHQMPRRDFTNDVQGPFFDPATSLYHMGYAWHVNGTAGIGSAPNRWYHTVSADLAKWKVVSTTPQRAICIRCGWEIRFGSVPVRQPF